MNNKTHFFKDKPLFGLDIGSSSIKVIQLEHHDKSTSVRGYGVTGFDPESIKDGVITDFKSLAGTIQEMFKSGLIGEINTRRAAISIPASRTYTRTITLPLISDSELLQAVRSEAEQYLPMPLDELYLDYQVISKSEKEIELLAVAVPKKIVDSYMLLSRMLGLEAVAFDTTILAASRFFSQQIDLSDIPTVLIDFGTASSDITIHDKTVIVTGTIANGGDAYTKLISEALSLSMQEAHIVKTKYGLARSKKQKEINSALKPHLDILVKEIRRMIRYYEERSGSKQKIEQVITMGGGANMPGLSDYLTDTMRIPVRTCNPWQHLELGKLQPPSDSEKSMYVTSCGLALTDHKELFS